MIEQLELRNFQSHRKSILIFDPGVNAIVGSSDSGKTAILRAFRWLIWNRPLGDSFRSHWGGDTSVILTIPSFVIKRWKTDTEHGYKINDTVLTGIKTDVPEIIQKAVNMDSVNVQQQFDSPFLLNASSGEVAQHFNKVANLDSIDATLKTLIQWQKKLTQTVYVQSSKIDEYTKELEKYAFLSDLEKDVCRLEKIEKMISGLEQDISKLEEIVELLQEIEEEKQELEPLLLLEAKVIACLKVRKTITMFQLKRNELELYIASINEVRYLLEKFRSIPTTEMLIKKAISTCDDARCIEKEWNSISNLLGQISEVKKELELKKESLRVREKNWKEIFPDICPLCGNDRRKKA
jgi:predicted ATP-dependent endonuclease of OLD family